MVCVHVSHQHKHILMLTGLAILSTPVASHSAPSKLQTVALSWATKTFLLMTPPVTHCPFWQTPPAKPLGWR